MPLKSPRPKPGDDEGRDRGSSSSTSATTGFVSIARIRAGETIAIAGARETLTADAGRILTGDAGLDEVGAEIRDLVLGLGDGKRTKSEELGHQEFILTYKSFEPISPACLPAA